MYYRTERMVFKTHDVLDKELTELYDKGWIAWSYIEEQSPIKNAYGIAVIKFKVTDK